MNLRMLGCAVLLVTLTALVTAQVASPGDTAGPKSDSGSDTESKIDTWVQYAMPGDQHKLLARLVGDWNLKVEYRMDSATPVVESQGSCRRKWILGNRFVLEEFDGGSLALPFQGLAIYGYDAFERKYTSVWVDTTSTGVTTSLGACQDSCDVIGFVGRHGDPWTGTKRDTRGTTRFVSDDQHVLELYEPGADGKEFKILQITYTRQQTEPESGAR